MIDDWQIAWSAFWAAVRAEFIHLRRSKFLVALAIAQAVTFLVLVSLFGITGARAPTALIDYDRGPSSQIFISFLKSAHDSFDLRLMDEETARDQVRHGKLVAMIIIPKGFSQAIKRRQNTSVKVIVDNINTDMTEDIQRALPSAIVSFGRATRLRNVHIRVAEEDLISHDTEFIPYLVVSALVSACFIISGILAGVAAAREYEAGTGILLRLAPADQLLPLLGRTFATSVVALSGIGMAAIIVVCGYGIHPVHPFEMAGTLILCSLLFGVGGMMLGVIVKRTLPVASIIFGLSLPLFLFSGSYEPERFDGNLIWTVAHFSPVYYAVGVIQHAVLGLIVTPESVATNLGALVCWCGGMLVVAAIILRYRQSPC